MAARWRVHKTGPQEISNMKILVTGGTGKVGAQVDTKTLQKKPQ
jgi:FlaA1/EpsC-like NDP-sugar epimerase